MRWGQTLFARTIEMTEATSGPDEVRPADQGEIWAE